MSYLLSNCHSSDYHYTHDMSDTALATTVPHSTFLFIQQVINRHISETMHDMINNTIFLKLYKLITPHVDKNYRYFPPTAFEIYTRDTFARYTDNLKDHQIKDRLVDLSIQICREWKFASAETKEVYRILERCSHIVYEYMMKISRHDNVEKSSHISSLINSSTFISNTNHFRSEFKNKSPLVPFTDQTDNKTLSKPISNSTKQNSLNLLLHKDSLSSDTLDSLTSQTSLESSKQPVKRFSPMNKPFQPPMESQIRREFLTNTSKISSYFSFNNNQSIVTPSLMQIRETKSVYPIQALDMRTNFLNNAYDLKLVRSINEKLEIDLHCKISLSW
ncbi:16611_t:CDS:2 [Gigaspora rosea]|nr:16611_t:CDS:2 [Gigaspora rosea]